MKQRYSFAVHLILFYLFIYLFLFLFLASSPGVRLEVDTARILGHHRLYLIWKDIAPIRQMLSFLAPVSLSTLHVPLFPRSYIHTHLVLPLFLSLIRRLVSITRQSTSVFFKWFGWGERNLFTKKIG